MRQNDLECVRRVFREVVPPAFHRCFRDEAAARLAHYNEDALFDTLVALCQVGAEMLSFRSTLRHHSAAEQLLEVDQDVLPLVHCLTMAFDRGLLVYRHNPPLPEPHASEQHLPRGVFARPCSFPGVQKAPVGNADPGMSEEEEEEEDAWLLDLLDLRGDASGVEAICEV